MKATHLTTPIQTTRTHQPISTPSTPKASAPGAISSAKDAAHGQVDLSKAGKPTWKPGSTEKWHHSHAVKPEFGKKPVHKPVHKPGAKDPGAGKAPDAGHGIHGGKQPVAAAPEWKPGHIPAIPVDPRIGTLR